MTISNASMTHSKADGYVGEVQFRVEGHAQAYVITLHSKSGKDWGYGLHFLNDSGSEEEISAVEEWLEEEDDAFDRLVEAARLALAKG